MLVPLEKPNFWSDRVRFSLYGLPGCDDYDEYDPETRDEVIADDLCADCYYDIKSEYQKYYSRLEKWTKDYDRLHTLYYKGDKSEAIINGANALLKEIKSMNWGTRYMSSTLESVWKVADSVISPSGSRYRNGRHNWRHEKEYTMMYKFCKFFKEVVYTVQKGCEAMTQKKSTPSTPTTALKLIKDNFNRLN